MERHEIIEKLKDDANYYGTFGKKFLSNSDISVLLKNPSALHESKEKTVNMVIGSYLHTLVLEPNKVDSFKILDYANRNYKAYKEDVASHGEICLLQHEADKIQYMRDKLLSNNMIRDLIQGSNDESKIEYEVPGIHEFFGNMWKGKADIINHDEGLVIDLKTTSDIDRFKWSVNDYNYDSQAFIYSRMFGYPLMFIVVDKSNYRLGIFEVSDETMERGFLKLEKANEMYDLFYKNDSFDPNQYIETKIV